MGKKVGRALITGLCEESYLYHLLQKRDNWRTIYDRNKLNTFPLIVNLKRSVQNSRGDILCVKWNVPAACTTRVGTIHSCHLQFGRNRASSFTCKSRTRSISRTGFEKWTCFRVGFKIFILCLPELKLFKISIGLFIIKFVFR